MLYYICDRWLQKEGGAALTAELCFDEAFAAVLSLLQAQPSRELAESCGLLISTDVAHLRHLETVLVPVLEQLAQRIAAVDSAVGKHTINTPQPAPNLCQGTCLSLITSRWQVG